MRSRKVVATATTGGSLAGVLLLVLLFPGVINTVFEPQPQVECEVSYLALDPANPLVPNPAKEVPAAFGPEVIARGEVDVKAELNERRECGADGKFDPALTASHYSAWSEAGLTKYPVAYTEIDAFTADIAANATKYDEILKELVGLENASVYSEVGVPAGIWSLYMDPNGAGGVTVKQGRTSADGTNAVFTHPSGAVIKYRLDCGFQVNRDGEFPGVPRIDIEVCLRQTGDIATILASDFDETLHSKDLSKCVKSSNPDDYVIDSDGNVVEELETTPADVDTEVPGGRGIVDTPAVDPGSESGVTAPGATPAPTVAPSIPSNEGTGESPNTGDGGGW